MALIEGGQFPPYEYREYPKAIETPEGVLVIETAEEEAALDPHAAEPEAEAEEAVVEPEAEHSAPAEDEPTA
jgi:hypothetical protein